MAMYSRISPIQSSVYLEFNFKFMFDQKAFFHDFPPNFLLKSSNILKHVKY